MSGLDNAWKWYEDTKRYLQTVRRLVHSHWDELPDDKLLVARSQKTIEDETTAALERLDDLAVVVLFSAFESVVRQQVMDTMNAEQVELQHPVLVKAAADAREGVEVGSFARVLEPYKSPALSDLIEQVNQVRRYRNWVAHGRRGTERDESRLAAVTPQGAFDRLSAFLVAIDAV